MFDVGNGTELGPGSRAGSPVVDGIVSTESCETEKLRQASERSERERKRMSVSVGWTLGFIYLSASSAGVRFWRRAVPRTSGFDRGCQIGTVHVHVTLIVLPPETPQR